MSTARRVVLETWAWKQRNSTIEHVLNEVEAPDVTGMELPTIGWRAAQKYPSEVHVELMSSGMIPDPYIGFNEHTVQWIGHAEWLYKSIFTYEPDSAEGHKVMLEFQGLDTLCDVYINGDKILSADNMFQTHCVELIPSRLQSSNTLFLHFKSALQYAKAQEALRGRVRAGSTNLGDPSRVYLRKAQYDWRWDWGLELMTCGIYRPVVLSTYSVHIDNMFTKASVNDNLACSLEVDVGMKGQLKEIEKYRVVLKDSRNNNVRAEDISASGDVKQNVTLANWTFDKDEIKLWWPVGYGDQCLYTVELTILSKGVILDTKTLRIGFRSVKLVQEALQESDQYGTGTTFLFEINGIRMFMGGSNWIPADNFLTTITPERYRAWLTLLRDGNQNMVRLWGGGIYEPDVFYDTCDELGLLVWQDFQFACGVYPAHDSFVASVRKEAEQNVKRLRHHPAIALFCGNNEDYQMLLQWGDVKDFPAIKIYEEVLPSVVETLTDPVIPYHRGSPYGGKGWDTADPTVGDVHQWNVWGGKELPYQDYDKLGGRFVSEFGMPSMPCMKTITYWMKDADPKEFHAQSKLMAQHCRAGSFERRFAIAMNDNFKVTEDLETAVFNTQLMQSEAVGFAYQSWRRNWGAKGKQYTGGVLVWQSNDCWPVTSWAIADYFLRPKPVYFTIARHLATFAVGITRTVIKNRPNDRPRQFYEFGAFQSRGATLNIWAVNGTLSPRSATLELHFVDLCSSWSHRETHAVHMPPNQATELFSIPCLGPPKNNEVPLTGHVDWTTTTTSSVIVGARLLDPNDGGVLARFVDWPQPYRFVDIVDPGLKTSVSIGRDANTTIVSLEVEKPAKCVVLSVVGDREDVKWSDNALDLMPGDKQVIYAHGLLGRNIQASYLGKEKARPL